MKQTLIAVFFALLANTALAAPFSVLLAAEDNWYPYSAKVNNQAEGRSVDIVKAAFEAAGAELTLDVIPFNRGMILTKNGRYAGLFNAGINEEVNRDFLLPRNYIALSEQVVIARSGTAFKDKQSFHHKRLTLTLGYTYPTDITNNPRNHVERAAGDRNNLAKLAVGHADYTIIDRLVFLSLLAREPALKQQLEIVGTLDPNKIYVVFAKTEQGQQSLKLFDQGMDKITQNGTLKAIDERWKKKLQ